MDETKGIIMIFFKRTTTALGGGGSAMPVPHHQSGTENFAITHTDIPYGLVVVHTDTQHGNVAGRHDREEKVDVIENVRIVRTQHSAVPRGQDRAGSQF